MSVDAEKYTYQTFWSEEDGEFVTTVAEFPRLSWLDPTLQGSQDGMRKLIAEVLQDMESNGEEPPTPLGQREFSGRFNIRISSTLHRELAMDAAREGVSLNAWVSQKLARA